MLRSLTTLTRNAAEAFSNTESFKDTNKTTAVLSIIMAVALITIVLFLGKWLYNNFACKYVTVFKPVTTVWQFYGLVLAISMFTA
jgi:hypothetical protein